ncbi:hypothetical protein L6452_15221 [Arctium lappa]|uniref:Uncharacterized protein n=1 Tax=Arctium lappa TaxID=4217 RepID=A0ACB9CNA7_ARCLA|nr:hypothetical protein L6452_15221 [Arctium lappa]
MIRLPGGRKRSERLMKKNSFSNYMNTTENPLDEDGNEIKQKSKGITSNKLPVVNPLNEVNKQCSTKVKEDETSELGITKDSSIKGEGDRKKLLPSVKPSDESDDDFMSIPKPVPLSSTIILDSDKPIPRKITERIVEGMKGITLNEGLKERIDGTRGRLRNNDTKAKDNMKRANESVLDVGIEERVRIPKREIAEIENGGLGSAPLLERKQDEAIKNDEFTPLHGESVEKGLDDLEHKREWEDETEDMKLMDDKIGLIVAAKYDTKMLLESLNEKYHGDETFKKSRT